MTLYVAVKHAVNNSVASLPQLPIWVSKHVDRRVLVFIVFGVLFQHMISIKFLFKCFVYGYFLLELWFPRYCSSSLKDNIIFLTKSCLFINYAMNFPWWYGGGKDISFPFWWQNSLICNGEWLRSWPDLKSADINEYLLLAFVVFGSGCESMILSTEVSGNCVFDFTEHWWRHLMNSAFNSSWLFLC